MLLAYTWAKRIGFQPYTLKKSPETFQIFMRFKIQTLPSDIYYVCVYALKYL